MFPLWTDLYVECFDERPTRNEPQSCVHAKQVIGVSDRTAIDYVLSRMSNDDVQYQLDELRQSKVIKF